MKKISVLILATVLNGLTATEGYYPSVSSHENQSSHISTPVHQQMICSEKTKRYDIGLRGAQVHKWTGVLFSAHLCIATLIASNLIKKNDPKVSEKFLNLYALVSTFAIFFTSYVFFSWKADKIWREKYKQPNYKPSKFDTAFCAIFAPLYGFFHWLGE